jgi:hypothetical protein
MMETCNGSSIQNLDPKYLDSLHLQPDPLDRDLSLVATVKLRQSLRDTCTETQPQRASPERLRTGSRAIE